MSITGEIAITSPYRFLEHPKPKVTIHCKDGKFWLLVKVCVDFLSYCKIWEDECNQKRDEELRMLEQTMNSQSLEKKYKN